MVCVLGKVCGHLASASELLLGRSGARASASRGRVWPISPFVQHPQLSKNAAGLPPFDRYCPSIVYFMTDNAYFYVGLSF